VQERSSCSVSSASHQFCTLWLQLTPSTWHAGCRIVQRPFRWLAEEQSRLWNRLLRASAIGPGHLLAVGTKDQAVGRLRATSAELGSITAFLRPYSAENTTYPQSIFKARQIRKAIEAFPRAKVDDQRVPLDQHPLLLICWEVLYRVRTLPVRHTVGANLEEDKR
jgi:hypothetical protein